MTLLTRLPQWQALLDRLAAGRSAAERRGSHPDLTDRTESDESVEPLRSVAPNAVPVS